MPPERKTLALIDGNAYLHRAFHALPPLTNSRGEPVGALYGFARMLLKVLRQEKPDYAAVCFDRPEPTFRHKAFPDYKANRKEIEPALKFQLPLAADLAAGLGLPTVSLAGFEADDIIATMTERGVRSGLKVVVVTGDKDALQLVGGPVVVFNEAKGVTYTPEEVEKKYGLKPEQLVDFFALTGDASDNVPGVPGVGEKTAVQLLQRYGTLDNALAHTAEMKGALKDKLEKNLETALLCRRLVTLDRGAPVTMAPEDCVVKPPEAGPPTELLKRLEFNALLNDLAPAPMARTERDVRVVLSDKDLTALAKELKAAAELSVDVETTGADPLSCRLVGVALAMKPGEAWYLPLEHNALGSPEQLTLPKAREALAAPLADLRLPKVGHNLKFDLLVLKRHGLPLQGIAFDTLVASYCLNPSRLAHGLKELARDILGEAMTPIEDLIGKGARQTSMDQVEVEKAAAYAGADAEVTLRLKGTFGPELKAKGLEKLFVEVEMPLVQILADMEEAGIKVDRPYLGGLQKEFEAELKTLEKILYGLAGRELNLNSPKQLAALLFEELKLPVVRRTKTGFSTDEEVLRKLSPLHPLPAKLVEYRELSKLKSTYIDALLELARPGTDRVHTRFNQAVTATGRLSSSDPNLQNIPVRTEHGRRIRKCFVPEEGAVLMSADYSQIDLRALAHVSGDEVLREAFRRGEDIHAATAREIFGLKAEAPVSTEQRRLAKTVNFGIVYGQTAYGLSQQIGIGLKEAQDTIDRYFARYAGVRKWIEDIIAFARKEGYVTTLLNRRRYLPEINAANPSVRGFAERTAMNTPIQGTSADIIKAAMREVARLLEEKRWKTRMLVQVHDELLFEVPREELKEAAPLIRDKMERALPLDIPVAVDLKAGKNWAEMKNY